MTNYARDDMSERGCLKQNLDIRQKTLILAYRHNELIANTLDLIQLLILSKKGLLLESIPLFWGQSYDLFLE